MRYLQLTTLIMVTINMLMFPALTCAQTECKESELSAAQINEIVVRARSTRDDLPPAFPDYEYTARRQGCYYVYIEYGLPPALEYNQIFRLNQYGAIVDAQSGGQASNLKCPEKLYTESELADIIKKERGKRQDLPPPFPKYRIHVSKLNCLYLYYEYNLPEKRGDYQVFTIDQFGELMEFSRSFPY